MSPNAVVSVAPRPVKPELLGYFRFGSFAGGVLLTTELGEWHYLDDASFHALLSGELGPESPAFGPLSSKGFFRDGLDLEGVASALRRRKKYVGIGPTLHVLTLSEGDTRLSVAVAKDILDFAMLSTSASLEFRLLPGEQPLDMDLLAFLLQYGTEKNRYEGKTLSWRLDIDPARLTDEACTWLVDKRVRVRAPLHGATVPADTAAGIQRVTDAAKAKRRDGVSVEATVSLDRTHAAGAAAIPAALAGFGISRVKLVPVVDGDHALTTDAWKTAYAEFLDAALASGTVVEESAAVIAQRATRVDADADPEFRSPGGAGAARLAYDMDGRIFPGTLALKLEDPEMFLLGRAGQTSYKDVTRHATQRALALASLLEALPGFAEHWATPFLGVDPLESFARTGDLFPRLPTDPHVRARLAQVEAVFAVLVGEDARSASLRAWVV